MDAGDDASARPLLPAFASQKVLRTALRLRNAVARNLFSARAGQMDVPLLRVYMEIE